MTETTDHDFAVGDILLYEGESYQVHINHGETGEVALFPSVDVTLDTVTWSDGFRKIGNAALPGPTPCVSGSCTPPAASSEVKAKANEVETIKIC